MDYILSPDGSAVYRLMPNGTVPASSFKTSLLTNGFTAKTGSSGSLSLTSYSAGFDKGGGAQIKALYNLGAPLAAGQSLQWVQVINTNDPFPGKISPYLDNAKAPSQPFYSYTMENRIYVLPVNQLNFYDYSQRSPDDLSAINPIGWSANLYPVIWDNATNSFTVENGISWGWTEKSAMVGTDSGVFQGPLPTSATVTGVGTNRFTWGSGAPSSMVFVGNDFNAKPNVPFKLGTLTYSNGENTNVAESVDFHVSVNLTNVPEKNFTLDTPLTLINTPNSSDPIASADIVSLGSYGYSFHTEEGQTASVDVYATLSTDLSGSPAGVKIDSLFSPSDTLGSNPNYFLKIVGLQNPTTGGFITTGSEGHQSLDGTWVNTDGPSITDAAGNVWKINHGPSTSTASTIRRPDVWWHSLIKAEKFGKKTPISCGGVRARLLINGHQLTARRRRRNRYPSQPRPITP